MSEATIQVLSTSLPGEEPFIGDLDEAELFINVTDSRVWSANADGVPSELGGAVKNKPIGPLFSANYLDVNLTSPDQLPIANTSPLEVPPGTYRESRILIRFTGDLQVNFQTYFDFPINWGATELWKIVTPPGLTVDETATNPVDYFKGQGRKLFIELCAFGPSTEWIGRLLWVSPLS